MELDDTPKNRQEMLLPEPDPLLPLQPLTAAEFPSIYDEAKEMLLSAILIYGIIDLRALGRKQLLVQEDNFLVHQLMTLPIAAKDVVRLVAQHRTAIEEEIGRESTELYLDTFDAIQANSSSRELELEFSNGKVSLVGFDVVLVDDENCDSELVYAICLDTARRRITVLFRGCSTRKDWSICANNFLKQVVNPLYVSDDAQSTTQPPSIAIHLGYCQYLFTPNEEGVCKFDAIVQNVQLLLKEHPGYSVYVTGHSLGGTL